MAVLGTGESHGGCSLLHAAGIGYGASLALNLPVKVRILDKESKKELVDPDNLLNAVVDIWKANNHDLPSGDFFGVLTQKYHRDRD